MDFDEFMAGIGMMKKLLAQSHDLDNAFLEYKGRATIIRRDLVISQSATSGTSPKKRPTITRRMSNLFTAKAETVSRRDSESDGEERAHSGTQSGTGPNRRPSVTKQLSNLFSGAVLHSGWESTESDRTNDNDVHKLELEASDLVAFLQITLEEAEEMIFLADEDDDEDAGTIDRAEFQQLMKTWA